MLDYKKDGKKFAELMQFLAINKNTKIANINERKLTKEELRSYFFFLHTEFENIEQFAKVVEEIGKRKSYGRMPEPADFLQVRDELFSLTDDELDIIARQAFNTALDFAVTNNETPEFEDKIIENTIEILGGWVKFYDNVAYSRTENDIKRREDMRKDFIYTYKRVFKTKKIQNIKLAGRKKMQKKVKCEYLQTFPKLKNITETIINKNIIEHKNDKAILTKIKERK